MKKFNLFLTLTLITSIVHPREPYTPEELIKARKNGPIGNLVIQGIQEKTINANLLMSPLTGFTLLMAQVEDGEITAVKALLDAGADVRKESRNGAETALFFTQYLPLELFKQMVDILIEADKKMYPNHSINLINHQDGKGKTLLHYLCSSLYYDCWDNNLRLEEQAKHLEKIKLVVKNYGANLDLENVYGKTPRMVLQKFNITLE